MSESVAVVYESKLTATQTLSAAETPAATASSRRVTHSLFDTSDTFASGSTPPVTTMAAFELDMIAGAAEIDFRDLDGTNDGAVDGNGLKVAAIKFRAKAANANPIKIAVGAANGHELAGSDFAVSLLSSDEILMKFNNTGQDIDDTHKILDVTGTGTQGLECIVLLG